MSEEEIRTLLEKGLYQNGEQPDIVLEQGIRVEDIEIVSVKPIQLNTDSTSEVTGFCKMYGKDTEDESITVEGKFIIKIDGENQVTISYEDFM